MPDGIIHDDEAGIHIVETRGSKYFNKGTLLIETSSPSSESVALMRREPGTYHLAKWLDLKPGDEFIGYFDKLVGKITDLMT